MTRAWRIALFGVTIPIMGAGAMVAGRLGAQPLLMRNVTPSMPLGLYRRTDQPVKVGTVVAVRQPPSSRAYLRGLGFPASALLLKRVVGDAGQVVCGSGDLVRAGRLTLVRHDRDQLGQPLPRWNGCRALATDELFLKGDDVRSFDSRYFGPVARNDVVGVYERLP